MPLRYEPFLAGPRQIDVHDKLPGGDFGHKLLVVPQMLLQEQAFQRDRQRGLEQMIQRDHLIEPVLKIQRVRPMELVPKNQKDLLKPVLVCFQRVHPMELGLSFEERK